MNVGDCDGAIRSSQHPGHSVNCAAINPGSGEDQGECSSLRLSTNIAYVHKEPVLYATIPYGFLNSTLDYHVRALSPAPPPLAPSSHTFPPPHSPLSKTYWSVSDQGKDMPFPTNDSNTSFGRWQQIGMDVHSLIADPQFVNINGSDWSALKPSSPALRLGFKPISTANIGPLPPATRVGALSADALGARRAHALTRPEATYSPITPEERASHERAWQTRVELSRARQLPKQE